MSTMTSAALAAEITNDPTGLGYASFVAAHDRVGIAGLLNAINAVNSIKRTDVMAAEVLQAIDTRDFSFPGSGVLAVANQPLATAWLTSSLGQPKLRFVNEDGSDTTALKNLKLLVISGGQGSQARLNALALRPGSRAELLWGAGTIVTEQNIADAGFN